MPKIVINRCYGGFGLSPLAYNRLAELQGKPCYFFSHDYKTQKFSPLTLEHAATSSGTVFHFTIPNPNEVLPVKTGTIEQNRAYNEVFRQIEIGAPERDSTELVQVVEELGERANGAYSELEIVEIPDGVQWEIDDYDGMERVDEVHRSWY